MLTKIKQLAWSSKKRKAVAVASTLALVAGSAFAYYMLTISGSTTTPTVTVGSGSGSGTINLEVCAGNGASAIDATNGCTSSANPLPANMVPGSSGTFEVAAQNPNNQPISWSSMTGKTNIDAAHAAAGCDASWFPVTLPSNGGSPWSLDAANGPQSYDGHWSDIGNGSITFTNASVDQGACKGAQVSVTVTVP